MLTIPEINRINHLQPGESVKLNGQLLVCHTGQEYLSKIGCIHCAFHMIKCDGIKCLKGSTFTYTGPDGEPVTVTRPHDLYYTLHY